MALFPFTAFFPQRIWVFIRDAEKYWFVSVISLRPLESEGNGTPLYSEDPKPRIYRTVSSFEQKLPSDRRLLANRKKSVVLVSIGSVTSSFSYTLKVKCHHGEEIEVFRRRTKALGKKPHPTGGIINSSRRTVGAR
jgi:two-component system LytT family response regulator